MARQIQETVDAKEVITTLFLPEKALQGEDVPCYLLWKTPQPGEICIKIPDTLELKEAYNVPEGGFTLEDGVLKVPKVEVDGYLGLLFVSSSLDQVSKISKLELNFNDSSGNSFAQTEKTIRLYRPLLEMEHVPRLMRFDLDRQTVTQGLRMKNLGQGTLIVGVEVSGEDGVVIKEPVGIIEFRDNLSRDMSAGFMKLREIYPEYNEIMDQMLAWVKKPPDISNRETIAKMRELDERYESVSEEFLNQFLEVIIDAWRGNAQFTTVQQQLLHYLNSIGKRQILLHEPLNVLQFKRTNTRLKLRLNPANMIFNQYDSIDLPSIEVQVNKVGEIPVYKLFEW